MANTSEGGIFAPLVIVVRNAMGEKEFNQFRGKAISLHSQGERAPRPPPARPALGSASRAAIASSWPRGQPGRPPPSRIGP